MTHKVDTDGGNVGLGVGVVGKSKQQARLSNTGITDEEELEEIVVSGGKYVRTGLSVASKWFQQIRFGARFRRDAMGTLERLGQHRGFLVRRLSQRRGRGVLLGVHDGGGSQESRVW